MARHIFITGASGGIGEAAAYRFAGDAENLTLASTDWGRGSAAAVAEKFAGLPSSCLFISGDISWRQDVEKMFREAAERFGPVDVLVNCAGVYPSAPVPEVTDEQWDRVMGVNLYGTFVCSQTAAAQMLPRGRGWIVNISSIDGEAPGPNNCVYSASKAGVISLTRSFAAELTAAGISVNAVAPGWVGTQKIYANDRWRDALPKIPAGRLAEPSEIAEVIHFLCSEESRYISGEVVNVNGGMLMN